nr:hypothetical protein [Tanacetum cinerariifolium]GEV91250.1 hypothetical protein [Tanacetum cinerariifolium]
MIDELDKDEGAVLMSVKEEKKTKEIKDITGDAQVKGMHADIYQIDMDHAAKVLSMQKDETEIQEAVEVVTTAKLITKVVAVVSEIVNAAAVVPTVTTAVVPTVTTAPVKEQMEEEENRAIASINETPSQKVAKRRRLNEEAEDVEELKHHLEIVPDEDDDVYTEATLVSRKVPVVDYQIVHFNNKPHYKIIRTDASEDISVAKQKLMLLRSNGAEKFNAAKSSKDY